VVPSVHSCPFVFCGLVLIFSLSDSDKKKKNSLSDIEFSLTNRLFLCLLCKIGILLASFFSMECGGFPCLI